MFTNAGWKAVAIDRTTARDYPSSLRIPSLTVSSPTNSFNTLLLNFAGNETPLQVNGTFTLGSNSAVLILDSGVEVSSGFRIGGTVSHADLSVVRTPMMFVGDTSAGAYHLTNGLLTIANSLYVGYTAPGTFTQHGGSNVASHIRMHTGEYVVRNGDIIAGAVTIGEEANGYLYQFGGRVHATNRVSLGGDSGGSLTDGFGHYIMSGGTLSTPFLRVGLGRSRFSPYPFGGNAVFEQTGGSNFVETLVVGNGPRTNIYSFKDGLLVSSASSVAGRGAFLQDGGIHSVNGTLIVSGYEERGPLPIPAGYTLSRGEVSSRGVTISIGTFTQSGGTNKVAGDLVLRDQYYAQSSYLLSAGTLQTSNTTVFGSRGRFAHSGGTHMVDGLLDVYRALSPYMYDRPSSYTFSAGELIVRDIRLNLDAIFYHIGGTVRQSGTMLLAGGQWHSAAGSHHLGRLQLKGTNSAFILTNGATTVRFLASSGVAWDPGAELAISNWRGATNGGGEHQVMFGNSPAGITSQQLTQIYFINPIGLPGGEYSATILANGEIVPLLPTGRFPAIRFQQSSDYLSLEWPFGYTLQTATNLAGPFKDVSLPSPYIIYTRADAQRYFRLRP